jgi:hypothetical protein
MILDDGDFSVTTKEICTIRDDVYLSLDMEVKESGSVHVTGCEMNYTNEEYADMHLILGEACGNSVKAERFNNASFLNRWTSSRRFE